MNAARLERFFKEFDDKEVRLVLTPGLITIEYREPWSRRWRAANSAPLDYEMLKAMLTHLKLIDASE